jgi:hypothetical protein
MFPETKSRHTYVHTLGSPFDFFAVGDSQNFAGWFSSELWSNAGACFPAGAARTAPGAKTIISCSATEKKNPRTSILSAAATGAPTSSSEHAGAPKKFKLFEKREALGTRKALVRGHKYGVISISEKMKKSPAPRPLSNI